MIRGGYTFGKAARLILKKLDEGDEIYVAALKRSMEYYKIYDYVEETNHVETLRRLFGEGVNRREPIAVIAADEFCSSRTIYRDKRKYVRCIQYFVDMLLAERRAAEDTHPKN